MNGRGSVLGWGALAVGLVLAAGCVAVTTGGGPSRQVRTFLSNEGVAVLQGATKVEVFRVDPGFPPKDRPDDPKADAPAGEKVGDYAVTAKGKDQGPEFAARLRAILFNDRTYLFDMAKGCIFQPGVAFRVWNGKESMDVFLCFSCDELLILVKDESGAVVHLAQEDFDPMRAELVKLAREAFPDDPEIQGLQERK
jgi:hypothetical protein